MPQTSKALQGEAFKTQKMNTFELAGVAFIAGGLVAGAIALLPGDAFRECRTQYFPGLQDIGGNFALVTDRGRIVTDSKLFERPVVMRFGSVQCGQTCSSEDARNAEASSLLSERGIDVQPVFVSLDPIRETPEVLRNYTREIHQDLLGLTGRPDQVEAAARAYGIEVETSNPRGDRDAIPKHETQSFVVLPKHGVVDVIARGVSALDAATRIGCFVQHA